VTDSPNRPGSTDPPASPEPPVAPPPVSFRSILLGGGPRFARDAFGPVVTFYVVWKLAGIIPGILAATAVSLAAYRYERSRDRSGVMARVALGFVLVQAIVGIATRSAELYLLQPILVNACFGAAFIVSVFVGRPLAGVFADELYPFPDEVRQSETFRRVFGRVSLAWGVYQLLRSAVRAFALLGLGVDLYLVVNFTTGVPLTALLMSWSVWYGVRGFRRSDEWGPVIAALEEEESPGGPSPTR